MPGEVLYRKWRPPRFEDVVGQDVVTQTLTRAVAGNRTAHAYLFCGPRGTGKTSTARVMAKALNCTMRPDGVGDPCGACDACRAIENGSFVDLIEIDAASNRGIDEMRDLREKVRFAPSLGKTKVYIIDEAHALTADAFNAFLKTLEEPPPQTVFILATTEPHKLPATIISRCQRFDFHRISTAAIVDRLAEIAASEGAELAPDALRTIARTAGGSLRDATNVLDQLITSFGTSPTLEQLQELLGIGGEEQALALAKHLLTGDTTASLELVNAVAAEGVDLRPLHRMTVDFLRAALLMKSGVQDALDLSTEAQSQLSGVVDGVSTDRILRVLRLFGGISLRYDQPSPLPLELAAVELSLEPEVPRQAPAPTPAAAPTAPAAVSPQPRREPAPAAPQAPGPRPTAPAPQPRPVAQPAARPAAAPAPPLDPSAPIGERLTTQWPVLLRAMGRVPRRRFDVAALLRSSAKRHVDGDHLVVHFSHVSNSERLQAELEDPKIRAEVERVLEETLAQKLTLRVDADDVPAHRGGSEDAGHLVRAAMNLGGHVVGQVPPQEPAPPDSPEHAVPGPDAADPAAQDAAPVEQAPPMESALEQKLPQASPADPSPAG